MLGLNMSHLFSKQEPTVMGLTPLLMVETLEKLEELTTHLQTQMEFAIDLEHHSYRSYQGITCLMQISTRFVILSWQL